MQAEVAVTQSAGHLLDAELDNQLWCCWAKVHGARRRDERQRVLARHSVDWRSIFEQQFSLQRQQASQWHWGRNAEA